MKSRRGISVIELLVVIAIISILSGILVSIFLYSGKFFSVQERTSALQVEVGTALDQVATTIRGSSQALVSYSGPPDYTTSDITLILNVPSIDANGQIIGQKFDAIVFTLDNGTLVKTSFPDPSSVRQEGNAIILKDASVSFQYFLADGSQITNPSNYAQTARIYIRLASQQINHQGAASAELKAYAKLRNR